jgi:superfamily II DNA or RNA helicase
VEKEPSPSSIQSAFVFSSPPPTSSSTLVPDDFILDISKYIPVGCVRIERRDCGISSEVWMSCNTWHAFAHPRDVYNQRDGPFLVNALQEKLLNSRTLQNYVGIHYAGWVRMEFKRQSQDCGQVRVYVLPDDVGRSVIEREEKSLRKALHSLLAQLDISNDTWIGKWSREGPMVHIDSSLDRKIQDEPSLFYLFNTLPSPKPNLDVVTDRYANEAMYRILNSDIEGLKTEMYNYQRRSAALMLQREFNPGQIIDPRLRNVVDQRGGDWYCDVDTASCLRQPRTFEAATGGICAETMGLGKTLICLALILATRDISSQIPVEHSVGTIPVRPKTGSLLDMAAATIGRTGTSWKIELARMEADGSDFSKCRDALKRGAGHYFLPPPAPRRESRNPKIIPPRKIWLTTATLVVVPTNLVQQWLHEIKKHTTGLKVLTMNELSTPLPSSEDLAEYDILLFSKQRFEKEATVTTETNDDRFPAAPRPEDFRRGEDWLRAYSEHRAAPIPVPYHSPLKDLHFKRLIVDEGHTFGNSSSSSRTEAVTVVEFLQLSARWIVSGTPTQGLYGAEVAIGHSEHSSSGTPLEDEDLESSSLLTKAFPHLSDRSDFDTSFEPSKKREAMFFKQERKDLEKLGNIATVFLKARPWANSYEDKDHASWSQHVMQPRHGSKSRGNTDCLKATLEGMIIRHRPDDVLPDIALPPLHQTIVYLEGSIQNKLSLNTFSMMVTSNAVTSERKDADYFFHPRQRKALLQLVANLRQASFFWSGFEAEHVRNTVELAKKFLEEKKVPVAAEDEALLKEAIKAGEVVLSNDITQTICKYHEMPMYIQNEFPDDVRKAWALDSQPMNPTLMGATMVHSAQKFVESQLWKEDPIDGLLQAGEESMRAAFEGSSQPSNPPPKKKTTKAARKKAAEAAPTLAGGVSVGDALSPRRTRNGIVRQTPSSTPSAVLESLVSTASSNDVEAKKKAREDSPFQDLKPAESSPATPEKAAKPKSVLKKSPRVSITEKLDPASPLASTSIISTASTKLSYLMDRILLHQENEKILVFYEADNVAYYIAQALECLGIKHLIYAKTLSSARRAQYVVTFNQSQVFRVLLMDVSQAAFGLDMSSASRVYFVNPVFSPQVEAQAVKRAHRIGQTKPVYVETLVLKGSIEEVIVERRKDMSTEEHNKCKSILDDQTMYDWIKNVRFQSIPEVEVPGPEQMAKLETPQLVFGRGAGSRGDYDPDEDLVFGEGYAKSKKAKKGKGRATAKGKRKAAVAFAEEELQGMVGDIQDTNENAASGMPEPNQLWNLL